eukprot:747448-Hanusia_phi.AAC.3
MRAVAAHERKVESLPARGYATSEGRIALPTEAALGDSQLKLSNSNFGVQGGVARCKTPLLHELFPPKIEVCGLLGVKMLPPSRNDVFSLPAVKKSLNRAELGDDKG